MTSLMNDIIVAWDILCDSSYTIGGAGSRAPPEFWNWRFCLEIYMRIYIYIYMHNILHYKPPLHVFHMVLSFFYTSALHCFQLRLLRFLYFRI